MKMSNEGNSQQSLDVAGGDFASPTVTKESAPNENKNKQKRKPVGKKRRRRRSLPSENCPLFGVHVCFDYEGIRTLGYVTSYDNTSNLYEVQFLLVGKPKTYVTKEELMRNKATFAEVVAHNACAIKLPEKEKKPKRVARKRSATPACEEASSSQPQEKIIRRACRISASYVH